MNNEKHAGRDGSHRDKLFSEKCHLKLVIEQDGVLVKPSSRKGLSGST